uniref:IclR family transcriptional regulator n=1 Tax=Pararhizobium sp. IMCC3301 TaxID=3067904 RepID=UPI002741CC24|nr:IclR family transcriptional regulator [Pararhizobium sp. IMCC3301]
MAGNESSKVQVIDRAVELLNSLSRYPDGVTLTELSQYTGFHKATVLRFLKSLEINGLVEQERNGKQWTLGAGLFQIASRGRRGNDLREIARPVMERTCRDIGETVQLAILSGCDVIYVEKVEPENLDLRINTQIGTRRPIHSTALGKVLVADLPWSEVEQILQTSGMPAKTQQTIRDPKVFRTELDKVRQAGFSVDDHEFNELVICAAAPLRNASGSIVAGLSISTFGSDSASQRFAGIIKAVNAAAGQISGKLGYRKVS